MKMTEKLERTAGTLLTLNDRSAFDLEPVCKLLKQAHDYILELEAELAEARRGEPVAKAKDGNLFWVGDPKEWRGVDLDLYAAPRPAIPAKVLADANAALEHGEPTDWHEALKAMLAAHPGNQEASDDS